MSKDSSAYSQGSNMDHMLILNRLAELYKFKLEEDYFNSESDFEDISHAARSHCRGYVEGIKHFLDAKVFDDLKAKAMHLAIESLDPDARHYFKLGEHKALTYEAEAAYLPWNRYASEWEAWTHWASAPGVLPEPEWLLVAKPRDYDEEFMVQEELMLKHLYFN